MSRVRSWTDEQLIEAVISNYSYRSVIEKLGLIPAGGNYVQIKNQIEALSLDTGHFTGSRWNRNRTYHTNSRPPINELLVENSSIQSYKLKRRLYECGLKTPRCELCGWAEMSIDGRVPLELDHVNGNHSDNRIENLRVLCPNCHSLQPTHRGKNKKVAHARVL